MGRGCAAHEGRKIRVLALRFVLRALFCLPSPVRPDKGSGCMFSWDGINTGNTTSWGSLFGKALGVRFLGFG